MKIGDEVYVHGYVDEIRNGTIIIRNEGGYFGTVPSEVIVGELPSAQLEQRPLTEDDSAYCAECDPEVKCLSCGHHIAERPFEVYCNIMCKWVNEKDCCTMFEPGQEKMRKTEAQI